MLFSAHSTGDSRSASRTNSNVFVLQQSCPRVRAETGVVCSGNGVCSASYECTCDPGFLKDDCSEVETTVAVFVVSPEHTDHKGLLGQGDRVYNGSIATYTVEITNSGDVASAWSLTVSDAHSWLSADPSSGEGRARVIQGCSIRTFPDSLTLRVDLTGYPLGWLETATFVVSAIDLAAAASGSGTAAIAEQPVLLDLAVSAGTLLPTFSETAFACTLSVNYSVESLNITAPFVEPTEFAIVQEAPIASGTSSTVLLAVGRGKSF